MYLVSGKWLGRSCLATSVAGKGSRFDKIALSKKEQREGEAEDMNIYLKILWKSKVQILWLLTGPDKRKTVSIQPELHLSILSVLGQISSPVSCTSYLVRAVGASPIRRYNIYLHHLHATEGFKDIGVALTEVLTCSVGMLINHPDIYFP